jgi:hypothetical protein
MRDSMGTKGRAGAAPRRLRARLALAVSIAVLSIGGVLWSCSGANDAPPAVGDSPEPTATASAAPLDCTIPNAGCPCTQPGEMLKCGKVVYKSENYTSCSIGIQTCQADGVWTDCQGEQVVTLNSWQANGLRLLSSQPAPISAGNACDPSLFEIPAVLGPQDGGLATLDGGALTLTNYGGGGASTAGCGDAAPPPLVVSPGDASLLITQIPSDGAVQPSPNSVQFAATSSGCVGDGSVNAIWTVSQPGIASVSTSGLLSLAYPYAGPIVVTAYAGSLSGTATVNVTVNVLDTTGVSDGGGLTTAFSHTCGVDAGGG